MKDIHAAITLWHDHGDLFEGPLHEYLEMSWDEYARWAETGVLPEGSPWADGRLADGVGSGNTDGAGQAGGDGS